MAARWNNHSACEVIRYLAGQKTPYVTIRQVVSSCFDKVPADGTFKIQMNEAKRKPTDLSKQAKKALAPLLEKYGPGGPDYKPEAPKVRKRLTLDPEPAAETVYPAPDWSGLDDETWLAVLKTRGEDDAIDEKSRASLETDRARVISYLRTRFNQMQTKKRPGPVTTEQFNSLQRGDLVLCRQGGPMIKTGGVFYVLEAPDGSPAVQAKLVVSGEPWGIPVPLTRLAISAIFTDEELKVRRPKPRAKLRLQLNEDSL